MTNQGQASTKQLRYRSQGFEDVTNGVTIKDLISILKNALLLITLIKLNREMVDFLRNRSR